MPTNGLYRLPSPVQARRALVYRQLQGYKAGCLHSFYSTDAHKVRLYMGTVVDATSYTIDPMCTEWYKLPITLMPSTEKKRVNMQTFLFL